MNCFYSKVQNLLYLKTLTGFFTINIYHDKTTITSTSFVLRKTKVIAIPDFSAESIALYRIIELFMLEKTSKIKSAVKSYCQNRGSK